MKTSVSKNKNSINKKYEYLKVKSLRNTKDIEPLLTRAKEKTIGLFQVCGYGYLKLEDMAVSLQF